MVVSTVSQAELVAVRALGRMREGLLLVLIGWIILSIGLLFIFMGVLAVMPMRTSQTISPELPIRRFAYGWLVVSLALLIIGAVLALVGFYARFVPGVGELARARPEFGTASSLIKVGYLGGLILLVISAVLLVVLVGVVLILVGLVFLLVGHIGAAVLCFKLNDVYRSSLYLAAGILLIVSIFIPILGFVSWILLYVALGDTIGRLQTSPSIGGVVQQA